MLKDKYDSVSSNVVIKNNKCRLGEIDVLARKGNSVDIYEVKCSHRIVKARHQLKRMRKYLVFSKCYFYCGSSGMLVEV